MSPRSLPQVPQIPDAVHHLTPTPFLPLESFNRAKVRNLLCLPFIPSVAIRAASIMLGADLVPGDTGVNNKSPVFLELTCYSERGQ